jgi:two-component system CheB/CheR fusion protein
MRIRRFTPMAEKVLNVIPTDIGRPLSDLAINLNVTDLPRLMTEVADSLTIRELEVQDNQGRWYSMRLRPYKTAENKIEGVVMTLIDIDQMKRTIREFEDARNFAQAVVATVREPLLVVDDECRVKMASESFYRLIESTPEQVENRSLFELSSFGWDDADLRAALERVISNREALTNASLDLKVGSGGRQHLFVNARQIVGSAKAYPLILLSFQSQS